MHLTECARSYRTRDTAGHYLDIGHSMQASVGILEIHVVLEVLVVKPNALLQAEW